MTLSKRVKVPCQKSGCGHISEVDIDFDEIKLPAASSGVTPEMVQAELARAQEKAELDEWRAGKRLPPIDTMIAHITTCPECFAEATKTLKGSFLKVTTDAEAKEIAKRHKLWPPQDIEIVGASPRMRS